ncbi:MAG: hypothetical protein ACRCYP_02470 [Alphaproteobacteria bacterium]
MKLHLSHIVGSIALIFLGSQAFSGKCTKPLDTSAQECKKNRNNSRTNLPSQPLLSLLLQGCIFSDRPELQNQEIKILKHSHSPSISPGNWSGGEVFIFEIPLSNPGDPIRHIKQKNFYSGANFEIRDASASGANSLIPPQD